MEKDNLQYPFSAIVGQEDMKTALILNVINPSLGGVLIRGEKGTAKSTAVRTLAALLTQEAGFEGRPMKVINLPVSATEDRVVGTMDIEYAIKKGEKKFQPGILAEADGNILYVDEVNLLDDHVVDILLDAAAMGVNRVEREGISHSHPARFVLVGTMNPEEGDLRPQLIDRFGLVVDVVGEADVQNRVEVIKRRLDFESDPRKFITRFKDEQQSIARRINQARKKIDQMVVSEELIYMAAQIGLALEVDGHRADITMIKTAITHGAYWGRDQVIKEDMIQAAKLTLPHRMRRRPFEDSRLDLERVFSIINQEEC